jgi:molybdopterin molybdotransferase
MAHDHDGMTVRHRATDQVLTARDATLEGMGAELVGIDALDGQTLAEDVLAQEDMPPHDVATMDGYAFDATEEYPLEVTEGEIFPEDDVPSIEPGQAMEIATGAPLPAEANAVLKREEATVEDGQLRGEPIGPGSYAYERASNVESGEVLFSAGETLSPKDAILLGDLGRREVLVYEPFSVGVLATGTEIHEDESEDLDSPMLQGLVRAWGHDATYEGTVPDDREQVEEAITDLADEYDVVLTTGGTSVGHKDYVVRTLRDLGEVHFHRVTVRPGKPIAMATLADAVVFAIPGKPLGAHTITALVARPFFTGDRTLPTLEVRLARDVGLGPAGFEYAVPLEIEEGHAMPLGHVDSELAVYEDVFDPSVLSSSTRATRADGFVVTETDLEAGDLVPAVPYPVVE